ncbi:hypothetical protein [Hymenobacter koreensis]|uniref:Lipoprotein n=1 Tax=Hymenobacter koreensis TaxID=1084523 RepID=A0ABP8J507_9BACT
MKTPVYFLFGAGLLLGACQRHVEGDRMSLSAAHTRPAVEKAAVQPVASEPQVAAAVAAPKPELTADMREMLRTYDLSPLWQTDVENGGALNGFFGTDHYRIEVVLLSVEKDSLRPEVYSIKGKDRYKKRITPFEGTLTLHQIQDLPLTEEDVAAGEKAQAYTATGTFVLNETPGRRGAGAFTGTMAVDFLVNPAEFEGVHVWAGLGTENSPTQSSGFKFEGEWTDYQSGQRKPFVWAEQFLVIGSAVLKDFVVGERDININPRYAKLGWDQYWENEEWWAEGATAKL